MTYQFTLESAQDQLEQLQDMHNELDLTEIYSQADVETHKTCTRIREVIRKNEDEIRENVNNILKP